MSINRELLKERTKEAKEGFKRNGLTLDIKEKIEKVYDLFDTSFIYRDEELILHKKWNVYFRLDDIFSKNDFDYKLLSYCSYYCADNHFKKTSKECKHFWYKMNRWFRKDFTYEEIQLIYQKLGSGSNRDLGNDFIESGLDFSVLLP